MIYEALWWVLGPVSVPVGCGIERIWACSNMACKAATRTNLQVAPLQEGDELDSQASRRPDPPDERAPGERRRLMQV